MSTQPFFPFIPDYMTWEEWNGNMLIYFSQEPISYHPEADWKLSARNIGLLATFSAYPVPDPELFDKWQDWAKQFSLIVNGTGH